jgi:hypothetical protein
MEAGTPGVAPDSNPDIDWAAHSRKDCPVCGVTGDLPYHTHDFKVLPSALLDLVMVSGQHTLLDIFAGQALLGLLGSETGPSTSEVLAREAYTIAAAMLRHRQALLVGGIPA